ncbi:MAG: hypothetical protein AB7H86_18180 [Blastocatellales bacterium]
MKLCDFCVRQKPDGQCSNGLKPRAKMRCGDFTPGIDRFCSTPEDYTGRDQIRQMAVYFGLAGKELKRVIAMVDSMK